MAIDHTMETGYTTKLNLKIGSLRFANGKYQFVNVSGQDAASNVTSCNT